MIEELFFNKKNKNCIAQLVRVKKEEKFLSELKDVFPEEIPAVTPEAE